jgi:hypothetical protein
MFVYSWVRYFGGSDELWPTWNAEFPYLLGHNMLTPLAVLRRGAFLRCARNQPEFEYNFEDFESWAALVAAGGVGVSLCQPLVCYRVRDGSMYRSATRNQKLYLYDLLSRRHAALYQRWGVELFNLQNANGPGYRWNYPAEDRFPLEEERDRLWSEVRRLAQNWEEQKSYIEDQQRSIEDQQRHIEKQGQYLTQVEQERDRVWAEAQRLGQCWEEQKSFIDSQQTQITNQSEYIHQLEAERARRWSQRMRRLGRRVWQRVSK